MKTCLTNGTNKSFIIITISVCPKVNAPAGNTVKEIQATT